VAAVRLQKLREEYGDTLTINWKSFPLIPRVLQNRKFSAHSAESWRRADQEEEGVRFKLWNPSMDCPASSMPALEAAKCAESQDKDVFGHFHMALMKAHFEQNRDISDRQVLIALARETGLDLGRFISDLDSGSQKNKVVAEYEEAREKYPGFGIPTAVFQDRYPIVGAVPLNVYRRIIDKSLNHSIPVRQEGGNKNG
jgi:predicted DsbA family dithiol-disulfide isomerase